MIKQRRIRTRKSEEGIALLISIFVLLLISVVAIPLNGLPFPGPLYKWVRINGVTELSLKLDVVTYDTRVDDAVPIYYDGTFNNNSSGRQVLELTALAVLPNGSQKLVQYLVAPVP